MTSHSIEPSRRDFLMIATGAMGAVGAAMVAVPFIAQMAPDASTRAMASTEVDISSLEPGMSVTVMWRGKPVFIRYRTDKEMSEANAVNVDDLPDPLARNQNLEDNAPATDINRGASVNEAMLIMLANCTHLGCIPTQESGDFGGWFCPCHGSHYDTAGRIRKGPAPENLHIPPYTLTEEKKLIIG